MSQGKLVRDNIPQIIRSRGLEPVIYTANTEEYGTRLRDKLREEVEEFLASDNDPEELADILEVLYTLAGQAGTDRQQLENLRAAKTEERGRFANRIIWTGNHSQASAVQSRQSLQRERVTGGHLICERQPEDVQRVRCVEDASFATPSESPSDQFHYRIETRTEADPPQLWTARQATVNRGFGDADRGQHAP